MQRSWGREEFGGCCSLNKVTVPGVERPARRAVYGEQEGAGRKQVTGLNRTK